MIYTRIGQLLSLVKDFGALDDLSVYKNRRFYAHGQGDAIRRAGVNYGPAILFSFAGQYKLREKN